MRAGKPRPDAVGARQRRPVLRRDRQGQLLRRERRQHRQREPGADALHGRQQPEPVALGGVDEAVKVDVVLAHMRLDQEPHRAAGRRQPAPACGSSRTAR